MRGTRAKELRHIAYGDLSLRIQREYAKHVTTFRIMNKLDAISGKPMTYERVSLFGKPKSPRATYLLMKRAYKHDVSFSWLHQ